MAIRQILTHPGSAHKDEFLACAVLAGLHGVTIVRREPTDEDLADPATAVVDVGGHHDPARRNFDHHQFPVEAPPCCALSLVLMDLGIYDDARSFCDWLETAERFDVTGPNSTAKWLGVDRDTLAKLNSPVDVTLLRRFAKCQQLEPGEPLYEVMRWIGADLVEYLHSLRERLRFVGEHAVMWQVAGEKVLYLPRTEPLPAEPSAGIGRYLMEQGLHEEVAALVYPDRRGQGYGLSRHNDDPRFDFTRIEDEGDVHFAHARGFVAKSSATTEERLRELLERAKVG
ncbi:MYG1 family protein [Haloferula sargassicola]|uniref:MYG1 family protein n=1 Tax=Haloferula sargassicola TaxID=490096 RepID=A0ABP9ULU6_9BACT